MLDSVYPSHYRESGNVLTVLQCFPGDADEKLFSEGRGLFRGPRKPGRSVGHLHQKTCGGKSQKKF